MAWLREHRNSGRVALLLALLLALAGPWLFEVLITDTPPGESCGGTLTLLRTGRCAVLISGIQLIAFASATLVSVSWDIASGATMLSERSGELFMSFVLVLLLLPIFSTALGFGSRRPSRIRQLNLFAWSVSTVSVLILVLTEKALRSLQFWGLWLYVALAVVVLVWELRTILRTTRKSDASSP